MKTSWTYALLLLCVTLTVWATDESNDDDTNDDTKKKTVTPTVGTTVTRKHTEKPIMKLKVTTLLVEPFMMESNDTGELVYSGYLAEALKKVAEKAEFEYTMHVVGDGKYGEENNDFWDGLIGDLDHEGYDLAVAPLRRTEVRKTAVQFTAPFMEAPVTALVKDEWDLKTYKCILDWEELEVKTVKDGAIFASIRKVKVPPISNLWARIVKFLPDDLPLTEEEGIAMVKSNSSNTTFLMEKPMADWVVKNNCELGTIEGFHIGAFNQSYSFAMPKNHPKYNDINKAMKALYNDGTFEKLQHEWWGGECNGGVTLNKMSAIFVAIATLFCLLFTQL